MERRRAFAVKYQIQNIDYASDQQPLPDTISLNEWCKAIYRYIQSGKVYDRFDVELYFKLTEVECKFDKGVKSG